MCSQELRPKGKRGKGTGGLEIYRRGRKKRRLKRCLREKGGRETLAKVQRKINSSTFLFIFGAMFSNFFPGNTRGNISFPVYFSPCSFSLFHPKNLSFPPLPLRTWVLEKGEEGVFLPTFHFPFFLPPSDEKWPWRPRPGRNERSGRRLPAARSGRESPSFSLQFMKRRARIEFP